MRAKSRRIKSLDNNQNVKTPIGGVGAESAESAESILVVSVVSVVSVRRSGIGE